MKHKALPISALVLAVVFAAAVTAQQDTPPQHPAPNGYRVLVCDLGAILENCEEAKDIQDRLGKEREEKEKQLKAEAEKLQARIQEIQQKKKLSERDDKTYEALRKAIEDKGRLDAELAYLNIRDQDRLIRHMQELLRGAKSFCEDIRFARKAEVVIGTKIGPIQLGNQQEMQDEMLRRRVITHDPKVDITQDVMKMMNEEYRKRKQG